MSKLPGRIPACMVPEATRWKLPEVSPGATNKVFKMQSPASRRVKHSKSSQPDSSQSPGPVIDDEIAPAQVPDGIATEVPQENAEPQEHAKPQEPEDPEEPDEKMADAAASRDDAYELRLKEAQSDGFAEGEARGFLEGKVEGLEKGEVAGREQGRREAESAFVQEVNSRKKLLEELFSGFSQPVDDAQTLKDCLVELVTNLAEVVILSELQSNPEHIRKLVDSALEAIPHGQSNIRVNVNPAELEWLKEVGSGLAADVEFVADPNLSIGSCKVSSVGSSIDGTLSNRIHDCLIKVFANERIENLTEADLLQTASEIRDA